MFYVLLQSVAELVNLYPSHCAFGGEHLRLLSLILFVSLILMLYIILMLSLILFLPLILLC